MDETDRRHLCSGDLTIVFQQLFLELRECEPVLWGAGAIVIETHLVQLNPQKKHRHWYQWHPYSSTLAWEIPWMEEPGGLQSTGSQRVGYDWATSLSLSPWARSERRAVWAPGPGLCEWLCYWLGQRTINWAGGRGTTGAASVLDRTLTVPSACRAQAGEAADALLGKGACLPSATGSPRFCRPPRSGCPWRHTCRWYSTRPVCRGPCCSWGPCGNAVGACSP